MTRTALIVGASRGLGLGLAQRHLERDWSVIATVRGRSEALESLGGRLRIETMDMTDQTQIEALADRLAGTSLDLLFVNAGIAHDPQQTIAQIPDHLFQTIMATNALAPMRVIDRLLPSMAPGGTIAVMSSGLASIANNGSGGFDTYRASKAALNTLLKSAAAGDKDGGHTWLAVDPGWVRTDMGGEEAPLDVETSTGGIADMLAVNQGRGGVAFLDHRGQVVAW